MSSLIRHADVRDVPALGKIINNCAEYGQMLHRSLEYLYENVRDFHVATDGSAIVGVCGLKVVWANLAEVYALAVAPQQRGKGLGLRLVESCCDEARNLGIARLMTLTYEQLFFSKLGFEILDRQQLPLKVWNECVGCSKNQNCDEIAMLRVLSDVPEAEAPASAPASDDAYIVPVTVKVGRSSQRQKMDEAH